MVQQPPAPAKKSNRTLIIIIAVIVVLCICCCVIFAGLSLFTDVGKIWDQLLGTGLILGPPSGLTI
jgi:amino acid transporter